MWGFQSRFILTTADARLGLMDSPTKVPVPVFFFSLSLFFFWSVLAALAGLSLVIITMAGGGKWPDKGLLFLSPSFKVIPAVTLALPDCYTNNFVFVL